MLSLVAAGPSGSTSVTGVRLTLPGQQLAQPLLARAAAELLKFLLARPIVRLALLRQEEMTLPAQATVGPLNSLLARAAAPRIVPWKAKALTDAARLLNRLSAEAVAHLALIGRQ
jgi:hypothetical protein